MKLIKIILICLSSFFIVSCGSKSSAISASESDMTPGDTLQMTYARNLQMIEHDGITEVNIRNPWDTTRILHRYVLLPDGKDIPAELKDATPLRVPLSQPVVYSGVHASLLGELGHPEIVKGICDTEYLFDKDILRRVEKGEIADCGKNTNPDIERILSIAPDAVLLSPYENNRDFNKIERAGIAVVECADYVESTPLGRAEWIKFYGRLLGEDRKADSIFSSTEKEYLDLKGKAAVAASRPTVLFDRIYSGIWYVPERLSTTGRFIEDAGGRNPFSSNNHAGSAPMSPEKVIATAGNADFWLIRHAGENISLETLGRDNPLYGKVKAYPNGDVWISDTSRSHIFEDAAFHPQWLLADMISILHPELNITATKKYYHKAKTR